MHQFEIIWAADALQAALLINGHFMPFLTSLIFAGIVVQISHQ